MKKIVIIGASYLQNALILKAKEMGLETHVFAWECGDIGEQTADYFYPISIVEKEQILSQCKKIAPDAVCTIASDLAQVTVNYVANALGLPANSPKSIGPCTNKFLMREALKKSGICVPQYFLVAEGEKIIAPADLNYPVIVKPTDRSGSRGITKVLTKKQLQSAIKISTDYSFEKKAIIEEFITGEEYSCESVSYKGKHYIIAITKKYTTGEPHFIETGHMEPSDLTQEQLEIIKKVIPSALDALDITTGISHAEFRMADKRTPKIIEIGARMGGDCIGSHLVGLSTGKDFLRMAIDTALGNPPNLDRITEPRVAAIRFIFGKRDLRILEHIQKNAPDMLYESQQIGNVLEHEVVDSSTRFGYYILADKDANRVRSMIKLDEK